MANNKGSVSKKMMKKLADDLSDLIDTEEGCLLALKLFETIPHEARISLVRNLSVVHSEYVTTFFKLVQKEYPEDNILTEIERALNKMQMAGINIDEIELKLGKFDIDTFEVGLASKTRLEGQVNLLVNFKNKDSKTYNAFFFVLSYDKFGIRDFYRSTQLSLEQLEAARADDKYVEITLDQSLTLIKQAFSYNEEYGTLPAVGLSIYQELLQLAQNQQEDHVRNDILGVDVTPEKTVNAFCLAERQGDHLLLDQLSGGRYGVKDEGIILQSKILNTKRNSETSSDIVAETVLDAGAELYRIHWSFQLQLTEGMAWEIVEHQEVFSEPLEWEWLEKIISDNKVSAVFEVFDWHKTQTVIETFYGMELFQAGEDMLFYKWWELEDVLEKGIDLKDGVWADFILHQEELIVVAENDEKLNRVLDIFEEDFDGEIEFIDTIAPVEMEYKILEENNISLSQLFYQWELAGKGKEEKLASWLNTKLVDLDGMTPVEAKENSTGSHLLWSLFKEMQRQQLKLRRKGSKPVIDYRYLIKAVGWGEKEIKKM